MDSSSTPLARAEIGTHVITAERDAIVHLVLRGMVTVHDAPRIQSALLDYGRIYTTYDILVDVTDMAGMDSGARRQFVLIGQAYPFRTLTLVGASFTIRVLIQGIYRAGRALRPEFFDWSLDTVATEKEARQFIEHRRSSNPNP